MDDGREERKDGLGWIGLSGIRLDEMTDEWMVG